MKGKDLMKKKEKKNTTENQMKTGGGRDRRRTSVCGSSRFYEELRLDSPVFVYEGVEGHAVFPAGGEVGDVDGGIPARPEPEATVSTVMDD